MDKPKIRKIKVIKDTKDTKDTKDNSTSNINVPVTPDPWILQNKKIFPGWINKTFVKYQLKPGYKKQNQNNKDNSRAFKPFPYQLFLRDYMQNSSPYRGVLLYHGLGSGKTCSSILIAENLKSIKNVIVMLPASLKSNFINEGLKFCGAKEYQDKTTGNATIEDKYFFVSYNAPNKIKLLDDIGSFDNHVIIIEEVHNLISMMASDNPQGKEIYKRLMNAKNVKIVALSGTPFQNFVFEIAVLFNILRGYMDESVFSIIRVADGNNYNLLQLEKDLAEMNNVDIVEVNPRNKTISTYLKIPTWHSDYKPTIEAMIDYAQQKGVTLRIIKINRQTLFPEDEDTFINYFIDTSGKEESFKNKNLFRRRILGLVSYYSSKKEGFPDLVIHPPVEVPMSNYQYELYEMAREQLERKLERLAAQKSKTKKTGSQKIPSNFRVYSRQFSNFVFPEGIPRPFRKPDLVLSVGKKNKNTNEELEKMMKKESDIQENNAIISKDYQKRMETALKELKQGADEYLTPNALSTRYSPKLAAMLKATEESPGLTLVYSNFRKMEGIEVFSQILKANGYVNYMNLLEKNKSNKGNQSNNQSNNQNKKNSKNMPSSGGKPAYAIFSGEEDQKLRTKIIKIFTSPENKDGKYIKTLMITRAGAEGLDLKNIRRVLIMEPYWNEIRIDQVIGRAVRLNSHKDLPPKDRKVDVYIYQSVLSPQQKDQTKEKISTDQYIMDVAQKKKRLIDEILKMMKEMAVDCVLNAYDNEGNIQCFSFGDIINPKELAYLPKINDDVVYVEDNSNTRKVEKVFTPAFIDENNLVVIADMNKKQLYYVTNTSRRSPLKTRPKSVTKVALDIPNQKVYNLESVQTKKNNPPILLGEYNNQGQYIKY